MDEQYDPYNSALTATRVNSDYHVENTVDEYLTSTVTPQLHDREDDNQWWKNILPFTVPVVDAAKSVRNPELEIRLGKLSYNDFSSGVDKAWFMFHLSRMESVKDVWTNIPTWSQMEEFIFDDGVRVRRKPQGVSHFIRKASIKHYDIRLKDTHYDLRMMLKSESPAHLKCGKYNWVRFKERKSFIYKGMVMYDFTKVWEAKTIDRALCSVPKYEIEIECINLSLDREYIAKNLLVKCADLLISPPNFTLPYNAPKYDYRNNDKRCNSHYSSRNGGRWNNYRNNYQTNYSSNYQSPSNYKNNPSDYQSNNTNNYKINDSNYQNNHTNNSPSNTTTSINNNNQRENVNKYELVNPSIFGGSIEDDIEKYASHNFIDDKVQKRPRKRNTKNDIQPLKIAKQSGTEESVTAIGGPIYTKKEPIVSKVEPIEPIQLVVTKPVQILEEKTVQKEKPTQRTLGKPGQKQIAKAEVQKEATKEVQKPEVKQSWTPIPAPPKINRNVLAMGLGILVNKKQ
jgi:hypothetical protein